MEQKKNQKDVLIVRDEKTGEISVVAGLKKDGTPKTTAASGANQKDFLLFDKNSNPLFLFIDQPSVPYYENKDSDKSNDKSKLQDAFSVINSFMKEMVEDWNQDFQILLIEHADESFWTGDNKLEYFTTKANFDGDNALVPFHVIKKKKYENNNR